MSHLRGHQIHAQQSSCRSALSTSRPRARREARDRPPHGGHECVEQSGSSSRRKGTPLAAGVEAGACETLDWSPIRAPAEAASPTVPPMNVPPGSFTTKGGEPWHLDVVGDADESLD